MLALKESYRVAGFEPPGDELPDYLPLMLEFAALAPRGRAPTCWRTPGRDRARPRRRSARAAARSRRVLDVVVAGLGRLSSAKLARIRRLAAEGPPTEEVGLEPFAPPEVMPVGDPASARPMVGGWDGHVSRGELLLYVVLPYAALAIFVVGHLVALSPRPVRLGRALDPAAREPGAQVREHDLPRRRARRDRRPRARHPDPEVVDGGGRARRRAPTT